MKENTQDEIKWRADASRRQDAWPKMTM